MQFKALTQGGGPRVLAVVLVVTGVLAVSTQSERFFFCFPFKISLASVGASFFPNSSTSKVVSHDVPIGSSELKLPSGGPYRLHPMFRRFFLSCC
jgi:hypothetical protein